MSKILIARVTDNGFERQSFTIVGTKIAMKAPVKLNSSGTLEVSASGTTGSLTIGNLDYDDAYVATNGTTDIAAAASAAQVVMFGRSLKVSSGGTFDSGVYVKYDASGDLIAEETPTTKTVATEGVSLQTSTASGQDIVFVKQ